MRRFVAPIVVSIVCLLSSSDAFALSQPNGVVIPTDPGCSGSKPTGLLPTFACICTTPGVCDIAAPCPDDTHCPDGHPYTCESAMWHVFNDNTCIPSMHDGIDPKADAATTPETFHPTCALTFTLVTRGTAMFQNLFGWYNVVPGHAPDASDLHPMFACGDGAGKSVVLDITHESAYRGGDIGFFLLTPEQHGTTGKCAGSDCCPSLDRFAKGEGWVYYSERAYNPDVASSTSESFIHLLTYDSRLSKSKFYFAWEDIYGGSDDEFTDLVTSVDGVECTGGGVSCDTGKKGLCAWGVTTCSAGGVGCTPLFTPGGESCNGVDDDCNGTVDDGATCPKPGDVCHEGSCVGKCGVGEFKCDPGTACDAKSGLCVDPKCVGVSCDAGQACKGGACVAPCGDVTCPHGLECIDGACVDLCASAHCAAGQVCRRGVCFAGCASCDGVACADGTKCDPSSGDCVDPSCATPCAAGTFCKSGTCVDDCDGAKCPSGQTCVGGACVGPGDAGVGDVGVGPFGDDGGTTPGDASTNGAHPSSDLPANGTCNCSVVGATRSGARVPLLAVAVVAALTMRRRRRSRR